MVDQENSAKIVHTAEVAKATLFKLNGIARVEGIVPEEVKEGDTVTGYTVKVASDNLAEEPAAGAIISLTDVAEGNSYTLELDSSLTEKTQVGDTVYDFGAVDAQTNSAVYQETINYGKYWAATKDGDNVTANSYTLQDTSTDKTDLFTLTGVSKVKDDDGKALGR